LTATASLVAGYQIDRGRAYEFDRTDTGKATVTINDREGVLDPRNSTSPYFGLLEPLLQIQIELLNPGHGRVVGQIPRLHRGVRLRRRPVNPRQTPPGPRSG
jgi:hypothetical protein